MTIWRCSFCGSDQTHAWLVIRGPGVNICSGCVITCNGALVERLASGADTWSEAEWLSDLVAVLGELRGRAVTALAISFGGELGAKRRLILDELVRSLEELLASVSGVAGAGEVEEGEA